MHKEVRYNSERNGCEAGAWVQFPVSVVNPLQCNFKKILFFSGRRVFSLSSAGGHDKLGYKEGVEECKKKNAKIATLRQLQTAVQLGFESCQCAWVEGSRVFYAFQYGWPKCGNDRAGPDVVDCETEPDKNEMFDVYCFDPSEWYTLYSVPQCK